MEKKNWMLKPISVLFLCTFLIPGCGKSPGCWGDDKNEGLIEASVDIAGPELFNKEGMVINSDSTFKTVFDTTRAYLLPDFDFNTHTLLGLYATGGCAMKLKRNVISNTEKKEYFYKVIAKDCGLCKKMVIAYNWVKVPKLPEGWTVRFELKEK